MAAVCFLAAGLDVMAFDLKSPTDLVAIMPFSPLVGAGVVSLWGRPIRGAIVALAIGSLLLPYFFLSRS